MAFQCKHLHPFLFHELQAPMFTCAGYYGNIQNADSDALPTVTVVDQELITLISVEIVQNEHLHGSACMLAVKAS